LEGDDAAETGGGGDCIGTGIGTYYECWCGTIEEAATIVLSLV